MYVLYPNNRKELIKNQIKKLIRLIGQDNDQNDINSYKYLSQILDEEDMFKILDYIQLYEKLYPEGMDNIYDSNINLEYNRILNILTNTNVYYASNNKYPDGYKFNDNLQNIDNYHLQIFFMFVHTNVKNIQSLGSFEADLLYAFGLGISMQNNIFHDINYLDEILSLILETNAKTYNQYNTIGDTYLLKLYQFVDWYLTYKNHKSLRSIQTIKERFEKIDLGAKSNIKQSEYSNEKSLYFIPTNNMYYNYGYVMNMFSPIQYKQYNCYMNNDNDMIPIVIKTEDTLDNDTTNYGMTEKDNNTANLEIEKIYQDNFVYISSLLPPLYISILNRTFVSFRDIVKNIKSLMNTYSVNDMKNNSKISKNEKIINKFYNNLIVYYYNNEKITNGLL